jgi:hypothetical protein
VAGVDGAKGDKGDTGEVGPEGPTAVSTDAGNTSKLGTDGKVFTPTVTGFLPLAGGVMTGMISTAASAVGEMVLRFGTVAPTYWLKAYLDKLELGRATTAFLTLEDTKITSKAPILLPLAAPTLNEQAVNKKYVDDQVAAGGSVYTLPIATGTVLGGVKIGSGLAIDASGLLSASGGAGAYLPLAGGTMTGGIVLPTTVQSLTWGASTYNIFGANGGVAVRYGNSNIVNFTATSAGFTQKITTPGTGQGVEFGSGGAYLSKVGTGIGAYCGGQQTLIIGATEHTSKIPVLLPADPTTALQAAPKQYIDAKPTIVSIPAGGTAPDTANYPNNTLLVEYQA